MIPNLSKCAASTKSILTSRHAIDATTALVENVENKTQEEKQNAFEQFVRRFGEAVQDGDVTHGTFERLLKRLKSDLDVTLTSKLLDEVNDLRWTAVFDGLLSVFDKPAGARRYGELQSQQLRDAFDNA